MALTNEEKLKKLFSLMDENSLTDNTFKAAFKKVIDFVKGIEKKNLAEIEALKKVLQKAKTDLEKGNNTNLTNLNKKIDDIINSKTLELTNLTNTLIKQVEEKTTNIKDGIDGKDADEEKMLDRLVKMVKIPTIEEIKDDLPVMGEEVRNALELLQNDERLDVSAIKGLEELIKELSPSGGYGGGITMGSVELHFVDDETPSGTINGTNKVFTTSLTPSPASSLKVYVNGQRMRITEDYTFSGQTITFVTAPPTGSIILVDYRVL